MVSPSKVRNYIPGEIDLDELSAKAEALLHQKPFEWQLTAADVILQGEDVIVDVGTGSGKTLVFSLPLLKDEHDIVMVVSPLTALMVEQAEQSALPTVAVCSETYSRIGVDVLHEDILSAKFRQIIVSPEIVVSPEFRTAVLSKEQFYSVLRAVCIDEAHCVSLWGGSFRPEYAELGVLRGRFPKNVPFVIASATLPEHVLDDVRRKLQLSANAAKVCVSNARPNVALSVRAMRFDNTTMADLRFLLPAQGEIPITLVYCNQRIITEDAVDNLRSWAKDEGIPTDCIAFYHAKIGEKRKRELEEKLRKGEIRILVCTDAVGMGCDFRNIQRVVLWGLPPSFCALVQRAGRAGRDFTTNGEAILIVPSSVAKNGTTGAEVEQAAAVAATERQAENRSNEEEVTQQVNGVESSGAQEVNEEGVREETGNSDPEEESVSQPLRRRKFTKADNNSMDARYLSMFASSNRCLRMIWNEYFQNSRKLQLVYPLTTTYQPLPGTRCCHICEPRLFHMEKIEVEKVPGLKRGKKRKPLEQEEKTICDELVDWREDILLERMYPGTISISAETVLGDDVIAKLAGCGERIESAQEMRRHVRWAIGFNEDTGYSTEYGDMLLEKLREIYAKLDADAAAEEARSAELRAGPQHVQPSQFYGSDSNATSGEQSALRSRGRGRGRGRPRGSRGSGNGRRGSGESSMMIK